MPGLRRRSGGAGRRRLAGRDREGRRKGEEEGEEALFLCGAGGPG